MQKAVYALVVVVLSIIGSSFSLRFYLHENEKRCFSFEAPPDTLMLGDAGVTTGKGTPSIVLQVTSNKGSHMLYNAHLYKATKFSFRTRANPGHRHHEREDHDEYEDEDDDTDEEHDDIHTACISISHARNPYHDGSRRAVYFSIKRAGHKPGSGAASDSKASQVLTAMRDMHETLNKVTRDLALLQKRERNLLRRNELVGSRVIQLAIFSVGVLIATSVLQVMYFKKFFRQKKLL